MQWTKAIQSLWKDLSAYVKQHHLTGLTWNPSVRSLSFYLLPLEAFCLFLYILYVTKGIAELTYFILLRNTIQRSRFNSI